MPDPAPTLDLAALEERVAAVQDHWGRGTWAGHSERIALETQLITQDVPALVARVRALMAKLAQATAPTRCYFCGCPCPVIAHDTDGLGVCAYHAGPDDTPL